jgi:hypothetical protein
MKAQESEVGKLGKPLKDELEETGRGFKGSVLIENLGNHIRASERQHSANKLGRQARWTQVNHSGLLADTDVKQPVPIADDRLHKDGPTISRSAFDCSGSKFSLGEDTLDEFLGRKQSYHSPAPENLPATVYLSRCILHCDQEVHCKT